MGCRTAALGGNLYKCPTCGHRLPVYNPCQDRHCPKCHRLKQAEWVEARSQDLLPIQYFHVVFTVPDRLHPLFLANRKLAYGLLFAAASGTILEVAKSRLKARVGFLAVLHTWTQTLLFHPHVHCVATGGGLSLDGKSWIACSPNFFLAVRILSTVYRGKLLQKIERNRSGGGDAISPERRSLRIGRGRIHGEERGRGTAFESGGACGRDKLEDVALLQPQAGHDGEHALDEGASALALGAKARPAPDDRGSNRALGGVVGGLDARDADERPERRLDLEDLRAHAGNLRVGQRRSLAQQVVNPRADR